MTEPKRLFVASGKPPWQWVPIDAVSPDRTLLFRDMGACTRSPRDPSSADVVTWVTEADGDVAILPPHAINDPAPVSAREWGVTLEQALRHHQLTPQHAELRLLMPRPADELCGEQLEQIGMKELVGITEFVAAAADLSRETKALSRNSITYQEWTTPLSEEQSHQMEALLTDVLSRSQDVRTARRPTGRSLIAAWEKAGQISVQKGLILCAGRVEEPLQGVMVCRQDHSGDISVDYIGTRPAVRRQGVADSLLKQLTARFPGAPQFKAFVCNRNIPSQALFHSNQFAKARGFVLRTDARGS